MRNLYVLMSLLTCVASQTAAEDLLDIYQSALKYDPIMRGAEASYQVVVENETANNIEYEVDSFGWDVTYIHNVSEATTIGATVKDEVGVGFGVIVIGDCSCSCSSCSCICGCR